MGGLHAPDSSQRSQLHHSPMSWYTVAQRASEAMALSLAGNVVPGWLFPDPWFLREHFMAAYFV
eukprot:1782230-Prymnesium_polylepis.1